MNLNQKRVKKSFQKAGENFLNLLPFIIGIIFLISLANTLVPKEFYLNLFQKNFLIDSFIGAIIGSISLGTPIMSYIIGGELLKQGVSLIAVTAFLVSWVTVGIIQLPAESKALGKKFALIRNTLSFIFSILIAIILFLILEAIK